VSQNALLERGVGDAGLLHACHPGMCCTGVLDPTRCCYYAHDWSTTVCLFTQHTQLLAVTVTLSLSALQERL
jgi:hypothetical protein